MVLKKHSGKNQFHFYDNFYYLNNCYYFLNWIHDLKENEKEEKKNTSL